MRPSHTEVAAFPTPAITTPAYAQLKRRGEGEAPSVPAIAIPSAVTAAEGSCNDRLALRCSHAAPPRSALWSPSPHGLGSGCGSLLGFRHKPSNPAILTAQPCGVCLRTFRATFGVTPGHSKPASRSFRGLRKPHSMCLAPQSGSHLAVSALQPPSLVPSLGGEPA